MNPGRKDLREQGFSRRTVLAGAVGVFAGMLPVLSACGRKIPESCTNDDGLPEAEKQQRVTMGYVDIAADRTRLCEDCQQWVPAAEDGACGTCKVMKGPIHPRGSCKVFTRAT